MRTIAVVTALFVLSFGAACDPVVYSNAGKYELTEVTLLRSDGTDLGTLTGHVLPGSTVNVEANLQLHLFGDYELSEALILTVTPPIGPSATMRLPFADNGEWEDKSDTEIILMSNDGTVSTMVLENAEGTRVNQTVPTSKFGTFLPPFHWLGEKMIRLRLQKVPDEAS